MADSSDLTSLSGRFLGVASTVPSAVDVAHSLSRTRSPAAGELVSQSPASSHRTTSTGPERVRAVLSRTQSSQDRIEAILETGRQRANSTGPRAARSSPTVPMEPLLRSRSVSGAAEHDTSGDETAGTASWRHGAGRHINYQSMNTSADPASGSHSSNVTPRHRRIAGAGASGQADGLTEATEPAEAVEAAAGGAKSWWTSLLAGVQTMELENKGSVARDHLALERTFLAWLRTSLAFASIGIAVTQLFRLNTSAGSDSSDNSDSSSSQLDTLRHVGRPLGSTFLGISILILFLGYHRYYQSQQWILRGKFPASRGTVLLVSLVAFALMVASLVVVLVVQPHG